MDRGTLGTSGIWRTQVDQAKVYSRASRLRKNLWAGVSTLSIDGCTLGVGIAGLVFCVWPGGVRVCVLNSAFSVAVVGRGLGEKEKAWEAAQADCRRTPNSPNHKSL